MNKQELMNKIKEQCGDCEAWSGTDCTRNPYTQGCLKDEKKVELTDEEWFYEYAKVCKSLEDGYCEQLAYGGTSDAPTEKEIECDRRLIAYVRRLQNEHERLKIQVVQGLRDMKLEVGIRYKEIKRLEEENEKLKTLVSHFEQLEKQLSAEIERLKNESNEMFDRHSMENQAASLLIEKRNNEIDELQKQVEYWESETKIARRDIDEAVKDTAKEILDDLRNIFIEQSSYGSDANQHIGYYDYEVKMGLVIEQIEEYAKEKYGIEYGVEVE